MTFFPSGVGDILMRRCLVMLVSFLCLSSEARILDNGLFISPDNPSPFNLQLNSLIKVEPSTPFRYPVEENVIPCDEGGIKPWNGPATNYKDQNNKLKFAFKENKGGEPTSGPSPTATDIFKGARLFTSSNEKKSVESGREQKHGIVEKRILDSNPSPGGGH